MVMSKILQDQATQALTSPSIVGTGGIMPNTSSAQEQSSVLPSNSNPQVQNVPQPATSNTPISQQSFSMNYTPKSPPYIPIQPSYVPGIGVLGADLGGVVKGIEAFQNYQLKDDANHRANEELGIDKSKLQIAQGYLDIAQKQLGISLNEASQTSLTFEQNQQVHDGMISAAKEGGYDGVIEFLKTADPAKAVVFQAAKLSLDRDIMSNDVMKARLPNEINQALLDSYAVGSKFAIGIANAPEALQPEMYKQALPILRKIDPTLPDTYDEIAQAKGQLMIAQGSPENLRAANKGLSEYSKINLGKLNLALAEVTKQFGANSPQAQQIQMKIAAETQEGTTAEIASLKNNVLIAQKTQDMSLALPKIALQYNNSIRTGSKFFIDNMNTLGQVETLAAEAQKAYEAGEINSTALAALQGRIVKVNSGGGAPSEGDAQRAVASAGLGTISKTVQSWMTGKNVQLAPWELKQALVIAGAQKESIINNQIKHEQQWKNGLKDNPEIAEKIVWPSQEYTVQQQVSVNQQTNNKPVSLTKEQIDSMANTRLQQIPGAKQEIEQLKLKLYNENGIQ